MGRKIRIITIVLFAVFSFAACNNGSDKYNSGSANTVHIGLVYPVEMMGDENHLSKGVNLATQKINSSGGIMGKTLTVLARDDQGDTNQARQLAQTLCDEDIYAVIGHWSTDISYFVEDIYKENEVVMMTPMSAGMNLLKDNPGYIYRMSANNEVYAEAISQHLIAEGLTNPVIYYTDDAYGNDLAQTIERTLFTHDVRVVDRVNRVTDYSFAQILERWRAFDCDSVIVAASHPDFVESLKIIMDKTTYPIFGANNFEDVALKDFATTDKIFKTAIPAEALDSVFSNAFYSEYKHAPSLAAIYGYQAVILLADAMNSQQNIKGTAIAEYLSALKNYQTVFGKISYNKTSGEFEGFNVNVQPIFDGE